MYERWNKTEDLDSLESAEGLKEGGKILHFGLSFHHEFEVFKDETDSYDKRDRSISHLVKRGHHIT